MNASIYMLALSFFLLLSDLSGQVDFRVRLDTSSMLIGDQVDLYLRFTGPPDLTFRGFETSSLDSVPEVEIVAAREPARREGAGALFVEQRLRLTSFDSGYHRLPPMVAIYEEGGALKQLRSKDMMLEVRSLPIPSDSLQLQPIKPIIREPLLFRDFLPYLAGLLLLLTAAGLIYWWRRQRDRVPGEVSEPVEPAHERALRELEVLRAERLWQQGKVKEYQSRLTHIVRAYMEERFDMLALESTSGEILQAMRERELDSSWIAQLREMFNTADMVKFAKAEPPPSVHEELMNRAEAFVRASREEEKAPEEETETAD